MANWDIRQYEGLKHDWEVSERNIFNAKTKQSLSAPYDRYLFGRLLEEDLNISCNAILPPNSKELHNVTLQGYCIVQLVDISNIGANYEQRTEKSTERTRTLKMCLSDGYRLIYGFELQRLDNIDVQTPRGTKLLLYNVEIRHGLLLLTPDNCQILDVSSILELPVQEQFGLDIIQDGNEISGTYSSAIISASMRIKSPNIKSPEIHVLKTTNRANGSIQEIRGHNSIEDRHTLENTVTDSKITMVTTTPQKENPRNVAMTSALPAVFHVQDLTEDYASDTTDPTIEHLFYSPNTPRIITPQTPHDLSDDKVTDTFPARKRPRLSLNGDADIPPNTSVNRMHMPRPSSYPPVSLKIPFQYFHARRPGFKSNRKENQISHFFGKCCIKSVVGFQYTAGVYELKVIIEDGTKPNEAFIDPLLVEQLMGIPCVEFVNKMQNSPAIAQQLAAKMQFKLMIFEGIIQFRRDADGKLTVLQCHEFSSTDANNLLQRVKRTVENASLR